MTAGSPLPLLVDAEACCATVTGGVLDVETAERLARTFKALGDPTRVRLLSLIAAADGGEACICDLTAPVGLSQPTVSHHMRQLVDAGLVTRQQRGKWAFYAVVDEALEALGTSLTTRRTTGVGLSKPLTVRSTGARGPAGRDDLRRRRRGLPLTGW